MIRIGIAGGAGYTAGELIRLLVNHPHAELKYIQSESQKGKPIGAVHTDMIWSPLVFGDIDFTDIDILFICMGHGNSAKFLAANSCTARPSSTANGSAAADAWPTRDASPHL